MAQLTKGYNFDTQYPPIMVRPKKWWSIKAWRDCKKIEKFMRWYMKRELFDLVDNAQIESIFNASINK